MMILKVNEIFDLTHKTNSSKFTKSFINQHKGNIPVYGATASPDKVSYGYIKDNVDGVKYFQDCLTWNIDGSMCVIHKRTGRFSLSEKVIPLIKFEKWEGLLLDDYLMIIIQNEAKLCDFNYGNKAGKSKLGDLEISIPTNDIGEIDVDAQIKYIDKHKKINGIRTKLKRLQDVLLSTELELEETYSKKTLSLSDESIFKLEIGKRVLKKDILLEGIPLYSANVFNAFGYMNETILENFDIPSVIWGIDGIFDWNYKKENECFSITDHCGRLTVEHDQISPKYIWYKLRATKSVYGFNRVFRASLENVKEFVTVDIPVNEEGEYDIDKQNEYVRKKDVIERIKNQMNKSLEQILHFVVE